MICRRATNLAVSNGQIAEANSKKTHRHRFLLLQAQRHGRQCGRTQWRIPPLPAWRRAADAAGSCRSGQLARGPGQPAQQRRAQPLGFWRQQQCQLVVTGFPEPLCGHRHRRQVAAPKLGLWPPRLSSGCRGGRCTARQLTLALCHGGCGAAGRLARSVPERELALACSMCR